MIPLFKVYMSDSVSAALKPVLNSGYIGEGPQTAKFEKKLCEFIGNRNTVVVNSGTSALTLAMLLAGVKPGDTVISTPMTCLATNMAILALGAHIKWADVDPVTGNVTDATIYDAINTRSKFAMIVDWGGNPCDLDSINALATANHLTVIQDACHSFGAIYKGKQVGNQSDFTAFSFQAIKHLTTGDGGALVCPDRIVAETGRLKRWFGLDRTSGASMRCAQDPFLGYKMQMNDIAATIGLENLKGLRTRVERTQQNACHYYQEFANLKCVKIADVEIDVMPAYWLYTLLVDDSTDFINYMASHGIECSKVHERNDKKSLFKAYEADLPGVDEFDRKHVCIPVGWWLEQSDVTHIIKTVKGYKNG